MFSPFLGEGVWLFYDLFYDFFLLETNSQFWKEGPRGPFLFSGLVA